MKVYVILQLDMIDGALDDATVFTKVFTDHQKAMQEVEDAAIELWDLLVDPNNSDPEDKYPGIAQTEDGEWAFKDTDTLSDFTAWKIEERELV